MNQTNKSYNLKTGKKQPFLAVTFQEKINCKQRGQNPLKKEEEEKKK